MIKTAEYAMRDTTNIPADILQIGKPAPRPPRSPTRVAQIMVQNRRREYLERNPGYFNSLEHEFAGKLPWEDHSYRK